eukprot:gene3525-2476_t
MHLKTTATPPQFSGLKTIKTSQTISHGWNYNRLTSIQKAKPGSEHRITQITNNL